MCFQKILEVIYLEKRGLEKLFAGEDVLLVDDDEAPALEDLGSERGKEHGASTSVDDIPPRGLQVTSKSVSCIFTCTGAVEKVNDPSSPSADHS